MQRHRSRVLPIQEKVKGSFFFLLDFHMCIRYGVQCKREWHYRCVCKLFAFVSLVTMLWVAAWSVPIARKIQMKGLWKMLVKPERGTTVFYCELLISHFVTYFITRFVVPVVTPSEPIFFFKNFVVMRKRPRRNVRVPESRRSCLQSKLASIFFNHYSGWLLWSNVSHVNSYCVVTYVRILLFRHYFHTMSWQSFHLVY